MEVGFTFGKYNYHIYFDFGKKSLVCLFHTQTGNIGGCSFASNPFVKFGYKDFDEFCERVGSYEAFSVDDYQKKEMKRDIMMGIFYYGV
jgi:hypothetical protein